MTAIPISSQQMTLEEYLEFDYNAEGRYEYFDGEVIEMGLADAEGGSDAPSSSDGGVE